MVWVGKKQIANGQPALNVQPDGSVSWEQPDSKGLAGSEGFCGQTAVANMLCMTEKTRAVTPHRVSRAAGDITPGCKPHTLLRAIRQLSPRPQRYAIYNNPLLQSVSRASPVICLLHWQGTTFHYVTVVKTTRTAVTFNHWGLQDTLERSTFERRWKFQGRGVAAGAVAALGQLRPTTSIRCR